MIRRRRLIITPGPGRSLPDPEDPSLPQVSPNQPDAEPPLPPPTQPQTPPEPDDDPREARSATGMGAWLQGLGVQSEPDARRAWLEPHLWAALRARVDAAAAERQSRWIRHSVPR